MTKTDNGAFATKLHLRRSLALAAFGSRRINVLDCCAGSQKLWKQLRRSLNIRYTGLDVKPASGRLTVDNLRFVKASSSLDFDVIDLDTYGQPWELYACVLQKAPDECVIFLTDGRRQVAGGGRASNAALNQLGVPLATNKHCPTLAAIAAEKYVSYCLAVCCDFGYSIVSAQEGHPCGKRGTRYYGMHIKRSEK